MIVPPPLVDEVRRLATLRGLKILDTPAEERFDRLTRLAQRLFNVPMALVSLIDHDRQWFKSSVGLAATQTARDISFCGHAIASDSMLLVKDARLDLRFHDNPVVTNNPHVRFYAGCPLAMPDGSRIGTLCLIDTQPREFSHEDSVLLRDLAHMAEQEFGVAELANLDELTGIPARRAFRAMAQHTLQRCFDQNLPASMLFFDLDGFKEINDRYGHAEGDRALVAFAFNLLGTFRNGDGLGRLGGDEFAALLSDCCEANAATAVKRLQSRLDEYNLTAARGYDIRFSVGCITPPTSERCTVEALLAEADARMYERKRMKALKPLT